MEYQLKTPINGANKVNVFTDSPLGKGATATVYRSSINGASYAAKIFHDKSKLDLEKIEAMLANPPSNLTGVTAGIDYPRYSWPISIIQDSFGQAVGYVMPLIDQKESFTLDHYYDKNLGKKLNSPDEVALSYKIEIAANLSKLIADLHSHRHCFVDCKPQNIRVFKRTHAVTLLDCDGFSINDNNGKRFPAELLSTDYISPEAFREQKSAKDLGEYHDRYALATIIFQLLNGGIHPFQGIPTGQVTAATNDEKAAQGLYPHGLVSDPRIKSRPQSVHNCFDDATRELFDKAFMGLPKYRPSAAEWAAHLDGLLQNKQLTRCDQHPYDIRHMRFMGKPCPECQLKNISDSKSAKSKSSVNLPPITNPSISSPIPVATGNSTNFISWILGILVVGIICLIYYANNPSTTVTYSPRDLGKFTSQINAIHAIPSSNLSTYASGAKVSTKSLKLLGIAWDKIIAPKETAYYPLAFKLSEESYELGHPEGASNLGYMYEYGIGTTQSYEKAAVWYQKAINMGQPHSAQAELQLAQLYQYGKLGPANPIKAKQLYDAALVQANDPNWPGSRTSYISRIQSNLKKLSNFENEGTSNSNISLATNLRIQDLSSDEKESIEATCNQERNLGGTPGYTACIDRNLKLLSIGPRLPNLNSLPYDQKSKIEALCSQDKFLKGPAAYAACVRRGLSQSGN